jgi:DNA helicase IV
VEVRGRERPETTETKGDLRMAQVIRQAVRDRQRRLESPVPISVDGDVVTLRPRTVATARGRARSTGKPHNDARVTFVVHLLDDLAEQLANRRRLPQDSREDRADLLAELRASADVRREINLRWMPLTPEKLLTDLFASPARLASAADDVLDEREQKLLYRDRSAPWTESDIPLLDEAAELIGQDAQVRDAEAQRAARERVEALAYARGVLEMSGAGSMMSAEMLADRFAAGGPDVSLAERAQTDRSWVYAHAVVDEAQELSPMQWRMVVRRVPSRSMTVVGDVAQTGSPAGARSWAEVLDTHAEGRWRVEELTVNYRTPERIMDRAVAMLQAAGVEVRPPTSARPGDWDPVGIEVPGREPRELVAAVARRLRADDGTLHGGRFAVVVPRALFDPFTRELPEALADGGSADGSGSDRDATGEPLTDRDATGEPLTDRVSVHGVEDVKGLEFDGVVVVDPASIIRESSRGHNDLYVAVTRPTQRLAVVHHGDLPPGLDTIPAG